MPKPGDRVIIDGTKLGAVRREGKLLEQIGSLIKIRWNDGSESLLTPGAGTVTYAASRAGSKPAAGAKKPAKKPAPVKAGAKKAAPAKKKATKKK
jgi:hypothetical protein